MAKTWLKEKIESISDQDSRTSIMGASIAYKYM